MTKSGSMGAKPLFCLALKLCQRDSSIQLTSGERVAPLESLKPVEESNTTPGFPACLFQTPI